MRLRLTSPSPFLAAAPAALTAADLNLPAGTDKRRRDDHRRGAARADPLPRLRPARRVAAPAAVATS
jgi:hypothetical protein